MGLVVKDSTPKFHITKMIYDIFDPNLNTSQLSHRTFNCIFSIKDMIET